jgi:membrane protease YdiL (CAAX protease family)
VGMLQEVPFRGLLQKKLTEHWGGPVAILATSVLFVIYHFSRWFFIVDPVQCLYIFIASLVFGFVFLKTDSLWATIILHAVNNFVSLAIR